MKRKDTWETVFTKPLAKRRIWVSLFIVSLATGCVISLCYQDWSWFGRSGSIATISGLMMIMRPIFRNGSIQQARKGEFAEIDVDEYLKHQEYIHPEDVRDGRASLIGAIFTIIGTIIWGFGDLL